MRCLKILPVILLVFSVSAEAENGNELGRFLKTQPCPSSGKPSKYGCSGWKLVYNIPLECGGQDKAYNRRWLNMQHTSQAADERWEKERVDKMICKQYKEDRQKKYGKK